MALAAICGAFGASAIAYADDPLPAAEKLMDGYVEAAGGKAAFEKLQNRVTKGNIEFSMGMKGPFTSWQTVPGKMVIQAEAEGLGKILEGTDGETAWTVSAMEGARIKEGVERAESIRQAYFNPELHWRKLWKRVETLAVENVGDKPAYKVELTPDSGKPTVLYFDKESNLIVKMTMVAETPMGAIPVDTAFSDYKKVGDVLLPHKQVQTFMQQSTTFVIESIEHNVEIPKTRFELPIEIRQLQEKGKTGGGE